MKTKLFLMALAVIICIGCDEDDCCCDVGDTDTGYEFLSVATNIPNAGYDIYTCDDAKFIDYGPKTTGKADIGTEFHLPAITGDGICYMIEYYIVDGYQTPGSVKIDLILGTPRDLTGEYISSD